jgi:hypothetical protein
VTQLTLDDYESHHWRELYAKLRRRVLDQANRLDRQIKGQLNREILRSIEIELRRVAKS